MFDLKILYAEDNEKIRDAYTVVLKRYFKKVFEASNGEEARELYETHRPHILLTDINMPLIDGLELIKIIREKDKTTKVIVLSAYSDQEKLMKAIPLGLSAYLIKPIKGDLFKQTFLDAASQCETSITLPLDYRFDKAAHRLVYDDNDLTLTNQEHTVLSLLVEELHDPVSYERIALSLWDGSDEHSHTKIQNIIKRLRKKAPGLISSVYGFGYQITK